MPWKRVGDCPPERCKGRCCKHAGVTFNDDAEAHVFVEMMAVRGAKVLAGGGKLLVEFPQTCQWLTGKGRCSLHPAMNPSPNLPARPLNCDAWPTHPDQLALDPDCGFSFVWEEAAPVAQGA